MRFVKKYTCKRGDREQNRSSPANLENVRSRTERGKGLVNHAQGNMLSLASTNTGRVGYVTRRTVEQIKEQNRHVWVIKTSRLQINLENTSCDPYASISMHSDGYHGSHPFHQVLGAQDWEKVVSVRRKVGGKWMLPERQVPPSGNT